MRRTIYRLLSIIIAVFVPAILRAAMPYTQNPVWQSTESDKNSTGLFFHDYDLDGYLDLFVSNGNDITQSPDYVYRNIGGAPATTHTWNSASTYYSGHCAVGDIDADGYPEYFVANYVAPGGGTENSIMYKNNSGTYTATPFWLTSDKFHSFACELGDADGDGDLDIAFACGEGYNAVYESLRLYFNDGGTMQSSPGWQSLSATAMLDVAWADVDLDGDLDLAFCGDEPKTWLFYNNGGTLEVMPGWTSADNNSSNTLAWGDIDGDGYLELAVADNNQLGGGGKFKVYNNNGGVLSTSPVWESSSGGYGSAVCWYDFDRDGDNDLAAGRWWSEVMIYENSGGTLSSTPVWLSITNTVIEEIRVCDIDKDGVENYLTEYMGNGLRKVFYVDNYPMHWLDSVRVDGSTLAPSQYCCDLNSGWVSLASAPVVSAKLFYQYSDKQDLVISNWDVGNMVFEDTLTHVGNQFVAGDANGDGIVNVTDAVFIIDYIFLGGIAPDPYEAGDANCDGYVNVTDAVHLVNYIFNYGPAPC